MPRMSTDRAKRSRSWGRRSPSSGFMVPTRMKRAGWAKEMPSRSTMFMPHGCRVEQQVDDVIVEQVDLVDVEQAPVGGGQHARLEVALAFLDRLLDIQRAHHPVFGGRDGQVDKGGAAELDGELFAAGSALPAFGAPGGWAVRVAAEAAVGDDVDFGQQGRQGPGGRRLARSPLAANQNARRCGG